MCTKYQAEAQTNFEVIIFLLNVCWTIRPFVIVLFFVVFCCCFFCFVLVFLPTLNAMNSLNRSLLFHIVITDSEIHPKTICY